MGDNQISPVLPPQASRLSCQLGVATIMGHTPCILTVHTYSHEGDHARPLDAECNEHECHAKPQIWVYRNTLVSSGRVATTCICMYVYYLCSWTDIHLIEMLAQSYVADWFCLTANKCIKLTSLNCVQYKVAWSLVHFPPQMHFYLQLSINVEWVTTKHSPKQFLFERRVSALRQPIRLGCISGRNSLAKGALFTKCFGSRLLPSSVSVCHSASFHSDRWRLLLGCP